MNDITITPIGVVRSSIKKPSLAARAGDLDLDDEKAVSSHRKAMMSEIVIDRSYTGILDGIEDFSHLLVLYWAHRVDKEGRLLTRVHPMGRKDMPLVGVFSTCSPARPNPVLVSAVILLARNGSILHVEGLDAVDGSPVVDIKPYLPSYYAVSNARLSDWMERLLQEINAT